MRIIKYKLVYTFRHKVNICHMYQVEYEDICCDYDRVEVDMECWHTDISVYNLWLPFDCVHFSVAEEVIGML